jgi:hypothetical protein
MFILAFGGSVDVGLIAALRLEFADKPDRFRWRPTAVLRDDVDQRRLDVLGHALRIAADVHVGAVIEPRPRGRLFRPL